MTDQLLFGRFPTLNPPTIWEAEVYALADALDKWREKCRARYNWTTQKQWDDSYYRHSDIVSEIAGS